MLTTTVSDATSMMTHAYANTTTTTNSNTTTTNNTDNTITGDTTNDIINDTMINSVKLQICNIQVPLAIEDTTFSNLKIYPNPTTGFVNIDLGNQNLESNSIVKLFDIQGRMILTKEMKTAIDNVNISNLSDGVYLITIENGSYRTTKKIVLAR